MIVAILSKHFEQKNNRFLSFLQLAKSGIPPLAAGAAAAAAPFAAAAGAGAEEKSALKFAKSPKPSLPCDAAAGAGTSMSSKELRFSIFETSATLGDDTLKSFLIFFWKIKNLIYLN